MNDLDIFSNEVAGRQSLRLLKKIDPAGYARLPPDETDELAERFYERAKLHIPAIEAAPVGADDEARCLRAYHALGTLASELVGDRSKYGSNTMNLLAAKLGRKGNWLAKVREFAETYNQRDLRELCKRADRLSWAHVTHLLFVPEDGPRKEFQEQAASGGWTADRLRRVIRKRFPKTNKGGRKIRLPKDLVEALEQVVSDSDRWLKRCQAAMSVAESQKGTAGSKERKKLVEDAIKLLEQVARQAAEATEKLAKANSVAKGKASRKR